MNKISTFITPKLPSCIISKICLYLPLHVAMSDWLTFIGLISRYDIKKVNYYISQYFKNFKSDYGLDVEEEWDYRELFTVIWPYELYTPYYTYYINITELKEKEDFIEDEEYLELFWEDYTIFNANDADPSKIHIDLSNGNADIEIKRIVPRNPNTDPNIIKLFDSDHLRHLLRTLCANDICHGIFKNIYT